MIVGGLGRDLEQAGRLLGCMPGRDQPQDFDFARRQTRQALCRCTAARLTGAGEHGLDGIGAELSVLDRAAEFGGCGRVAQGGTVGPRFPRGLKRLGGGKDARGRREVTAACVAVIARAVEPLMMAQHQRRDGFAFAAQRRKRAP